MHKRLDTGLCLKKAAIYFGSFSDALCCGGDRIGMTTAYNGVGLYETRLHRGWDCMGGIGRGLLTLLLPCCVSEATKP